ncbi:MAG: MerR family transcriptional regulator [Oscillospiraceae bacterium]|nr:MerR family transcriptional regulator [Oscillospiraceae bacterium]
MKDLLTIKEFSRVTGVNSSTLRNWDKIGLFSPDRRDPVNNYRYYSPKQIITVNFITILSKLNIPFKTIKRIKSVRNPENIVELIDQQEKLLDMEMSRLRESYSVIHARRDLIKQGMKVNLSDITVQEMPERKIILGRPNFFEPNEEFYGQWLRFCLEADELRINLNYPVGGRHESINSFQKSPGNPDRFFSIDPTGNTIQKAGKYLVAHARGYFGEFGDVPARMAVFSQENDLTCVGPVYCVYLHDETCIKNPTEYLAQITVAVV